MRTPSVKIGLHSNSGELPVAVLFCVTKHAGVMGVLVVLEPFLMA